MEEPRHSPEQRGGRPVLACGALPGEILISTDGTRLRILGGYSRASRKACQENPTLGGIPPGVVADDDHHNAGIGQGCSCRNPWPRCTHAGCATFVFLKIGSKILKKCEERGTIPDELLQGTWSWKAALDVIKGDSDASPPWMQLRRSIFTIEEKKPFLEYMTIARAVRKGVLALFPPFDSAPNCLHIVREFLLGETVVPSRVITLRALASQPELRTDTSRAVPGLAPSEVQLASYGNAQEPVATVGNVVGPAALNQEVWQKIRVLSPSQLKSFMQKLVRWGPAVRITLQGYGDTEIGDIALRCSFAALFFGPGMFIPDIRDHSTGQRLALQRLVIILFEDGVHPDDVQDLTYWGALSATQQRTETPLPLRLIQEAVSTLIRGRQSPHLLSWREQSAERARGANGPPRKKRRVEGPRRAGVFQDLLRIFEEIGAMEGDKDMMAAVDRVEFAAPGNRMGEAPLRVTLDEAMYMHLDQHAEPLMPHTVPTFIWFYTTGYNPRNRNSGGLDIQRLREMGPSQKRALEHSLKRHPEQCAILDQRGVKIPYRCDETAMIAYAAGQVSVSFGRKQYLAVFCPTNLENIVLMRRPKMRETANIDYIDPHSHEYEEGMEALRRKPVPLDDPLKGFTLRWDQDKETWWTDQAIPEAQLLPSHPAEDNGPGWSLAAALSGEGCRVGWETLLQSHYSALSTADRTEVVRTLSELTPGYEVKMTPLTRAAAPTGTRHEVYTFVATIAQQCPGALLATGAGTWFIKNSGIFAHVRNTVCEWYAGSAVPLPGWQVTCTAEPHDEQRCCLERIAARKERRVFFMAKTGAGKTLVAARLAATAANAGEVDHVFVFMDTDVMLNSVVEEIRRCCNFSVVWLDPTKGGQRKWLKSGTWVTDSTRGSTPMPVAHHVNVLRYDHFASSLYEKMREAIIGVASTSMAVYDEVDKCYGETLRTRQCVPLAFVFKELIMMTATPLRKHGEGLGPRLAIASLFSPFPLQERNLLVFFCGHVKSFEHPVPYVETLMPDLMVDVPLVQRDPAAKPPSFDELAKLAFQAALPQLIAAARQLFELAGGPCIVAVQTKAQVQDVLRAAGALAQEAPQDSSAPTTPLVVLAANAARGRNFGRYCNAMLHMPLQQGVPARRQLRGRLHRGPLRQIYYQTVIPRGTVLECLSRIYERDDAGAVHLEQLVRQALVLERMRAEEAIQVTGPRTG